MSRRRERVPFEGGFDVGDVVGEEVADDGETEGWKNALDVLKFVFEHFGAVGVVFDLGWGGFLEVFFEVGHEVGSVVVIPIHLTGVE